MASSEPDDLKVVINYMTKADLVKLHHLAIVVADIERSADMYKKLLHISPLTQIIHDQQQKVHVQFLAGPALGPLKLELLTPDGDDSPLALALKKGGGPNHLCFEVADLEKTLQLARRQGCRLIAPPVKAPAIADQRIAFVFTPDQQIVEFLETPADAGEH